jgi:hypothetical protein
MVSTLIKHRMPNGSRKEIIHSKSFKFQKLNDIEEFDERLLFEGVWMGH